MSEKTEKNTKPESKSALKDRGGFSITSYLKITDAESKQILVNKRA